MLVKRRSSELPKSKRNSQRVPQWPRNVEAVCGGCDEPNAMQSQKACCLHKLETEPLSKCQAQSERRKSTGVPNRFRSLTPRGGKYSNLSNAPKEHEREVLPKCRGKCQKRGSTNLRTSKHNTSGLPSTPDLLHCKAADFGISSGHSPIACNEGSSQHQAPWHPVEQKHLSLAFKISYWEAASPLFAKIFFATRFPPAAPDFRSYSCRDSNLRHVSFLVPWFDTALFVFWRCIHRHFIWDWAWRALRTILSAQGQHHCYVALLACDKFDCFPPEWLQPAQVYMEKKRLSPADSMPMPRANVAL